MTYISIRQHWSRKAGGVEVNKSRFEALVQPWASVSCGHTQFATQLTVPTTRYYMAPNLFMLMFSAWPLKLLSFWSCREHLCGCHIPQSGIQSAECPSFSRPVLFSWNMMGGIQTLILGLPGKKVGPCCKPNLSSQGAIWGLKPKLLWNPSQIVSCPRLGIQPWLRNQAQWAICFSSSLSYDVLCPFLTAHLSSSLESGKGTSVCCCPKQIFLNCLCRFLHSPYHK